MTSPWAESTHESFTEESASGESAAAESYDPRKLAGCRSGRPGHHGCQPEASGS